MFTLYVVKAILEKKSIDIRRELTDEQKREVGLL